MWQEAAPRGLQHPSPGPDVVPSPPSLPACRPAPKLLQEGTNRVCQEVAKWAWGKAPSPHTFLGALHDPGSCPQQVQKPCGCWSRLGQGGPHCWGNGRSCGAGQGASKDFWLGLLWGSPCGLIFTWGSQDYSCLGPWQELWLPGHGLWSGTCPSLPTAHPSIGL